MRCTSGADDHDEDVECARGGDATMTNGDDFENWFSKRNTAAYTALLHCVVVTESFCFDRCFFIKKITINIARIGLRR